MARKLRREWADLPELPLAMGRRRRPICCSSMFKPTQEQRAAAQRIGRIFLEAGFARRYRFVADVIGHVAEVDLAAERLSS